MSDIYLGIDPGKDGTAGCVDADGGFHSMIRFDRCTHHEFRDWLYERCDLISFAILEKGWGGGKAGQKQGGASAFKFGYACGWAEMALVAMLVPYELRTPTQWQTALRCKTGGDKKITQAEAQRLWPEQRKLFTQKSSEGQLIAEYCRRWRLGLLDRTGKKGS